MYHNNKLLSFSFFSSKMKNLKICIFLSLFTIALCQENVQTRIPESLLECYQDPILLQRDYRLPMTMNMLIDLIRKVENDPSGMNMDMRTLVSTLLHR